MAVGAFPGSAGARWLTVRPWVRTPFRSTSSASFSVHCSPRPPLSTSDSAESLSSPSPPSDCSFFPKRGQTLELVCESLAFKGKGVCKVSDSGFVVLCDRALPGERFLGRVTRRKGSYAEVTKLKTITPHRDLVKAPCAYASYCGGCKTQNLLYEAQLMAKQQQVNDLIIHVGRFSSKDYKQDNIFKPIIPCELQFGYRNKMEFSFGTRSWVPRIVDDANLNLMENGYALGLHAPGSFDKIFHIDSCLLQSEAANKVIAVIQDCWKDPNLGLTPYDVQSHKGFLRHLMLRTGRDKKTGFSEVMVNFITSSYKPKMLEHLVRKISAIPEVVCTAIIIFAYHCFSV